MTQNTVDDKSTLIQVMAIRQQAITWANVDPTPYHHASSGHNEFGDTFTNIDQLQQHRDYATYK